MFQSCRLKQNFNILWLARTVQPRRCRHTQGHILVSCDFSCRGEQYIYRKAGSLRVASLSPHLFKVVGLPWEPAQLPFRSIVALRLSCCLEQNSSRELVHVPDSLGCLLELEQHVYRFFVFCFLKGLPAVWTCCGLSSNEFYKIPLFGIFSSLSCHFPRLFQEGFWRIKTKGLAASLYLVLLFTSQYMSDFFSNSCHKETRTEFFLTSKC